MIRYFFISWLLFLGALLWGIQQGLKEFPSNDQIRSCLITKMYKVSLCPTEKSYSPLSQISPVLQKAIILSEDSLFWDHQGFDWKSIEENFKEGLKTGKFKRGGSTISQQLAKNMYLTQERTFLRKAKEAIITMKIEKALSKKEILERYLNVVEFGKDIYGIQAAASFYFDKKPKDLDLAESAFLAMLLPNPKKYSQSFRKRQLTPFARNRMEQIIENMFNFKRVEESEYLFALQKLDSFFEGSAAESSELPHEPADNSPEGDTEAEDDLFL